MILLIDNYDSFTHNLYQYLAEISSEEISVVRNDAITVAGIEKLAPTRIVISPGPGRPEGAGVSVAAIRHFAGKVPILGVCLGHQAIAAAYGARIVGARRIVHGKLDAMAVDGRGLFRSLNSPAQFARYHSLAVSEETLPDELEVTARSADGEVMGVRHREHVIEGVQFHPESIASDDGKKLLANFINYRREPFEPRKYLSQIIDGSTMSQEEAAGFMEELTDGNLTDAQIAAFLVALNAKGIDSGEIAGCAQVLQRKRTPITVSGDLLDTCGTGGDGLGTFNISSLTALVAAAAGARVAKHGNRAVSSRSGSADFYSALGIAIDISPERAAECIEDAGFAFLFAPRYHSAMRFAGPARRQLGIKTIMNLLGPLVNPASASYQLIGVFSEQYQRVVAEAAIRLGVRRGIVVHGLDGQDEISVCAPTRVISFEAGDDPAESAAGEPETSIGDRARIRLERATFEEYVISPGNYGLDEHPQSALVGGTAEENAAISQRLIDGATGRRDDGIVDAPLAALHDAVVLNAGAALQVAGISETIADGVALAMRALEEGRVRSTLDRVIAISTHGIEGAGRAG